MLSMCTAGCCARYPLLDERARHCCHHLLILLAKEEEVSCTLAFLCSSIAVLQRDAVVGHA